MSLPDPSGVLELHLHAGDFSVFVVTRSHLRRFIDSSNEFICSALFHSETPATTSP